MMTKVTFPTVTYNVLTKFSSGDDRFFPFKHAGFYQFNATVCLPNITSGYIAIFRANVEQSRGSSFSSTTTSADTTLTVSSLIYLNGLGGSNDFDFCDVRVICSPATRIAGGVSKCFFTGHFIQP